MVYLALLAAVLAVLLLASAGVAACTKAVEPLVGAVHQLTATVAPTPAPSVWVKSSGGILYNTQNLRAILARGPVVGEGVAVYAVDFYWAAATAIDDPAHHSVEWFATAEEALAYVTMVGHLVEAIDVHQLCASAAAA